MPNALFQIFGELVDWLQLRIVPSLQDLPLLDEGGPTNGSRLSAARLTPTADRRKRSAANRAETLRVVAFQRRINAFVC